MRDLWNVFCRKHKSTYAVFFNPVVTGVATLGVTISSQVEMKVLWGLLGIVSNIINGAANRPEQFDKDVLTAFLFALLDFLKIPDSYGARLLFWLRDGEEGLKAFTDYVPSGTSPSVNRFHQAEALVGEALRKKVPAIYVSLPRTTEKQYRQDLVDNYNFSVDKANRVDATRRACFAIPILGKQDYVEGVLYIDFPDRRHLNIFGKDVKTAKRRLKEVGNLMYPLIRQMKGGR